MRLRNLWIGLAVLGATTAAAFAPDGVMPDATRQYFERQNCHQVYDMLVEQDRSGNRLSDADAGWAKAYEDNGPAGKPCPTPPEALAKRATNRTMVTAQALGKAVDYHDQKDPSATFEIALAAMTGTTKELTPGQGLTLLEEAAALGDPSALYQLSQQYFAGNFGKAKDYAGGIPPLLKAAETGHIDALFQAGAIYANGLGAKKDLKRAFTYFSQAAERGHVFGTYLAAQMANGGVGTKKDPVLAYRLARNLADQGQVAGAVIAASALLQQKNVKQHEAEVLYWMDVAARDGDERIRTEMAKFRPQVTSLFQRMNAPPEYRPRERKVCPMKRTCTVNHYSGLQQCTTNKDYWSDCDG
jgi:TPR repeat protein